MYKKTNYEAPEAEILEVRFEGNFCASPADNQNGTENSPVYNPFKEW